MQTIVFPNRPVEISRNLKAGQRLIASLDRPIPLSQQRRTVAGQGWHGHLWRNVPHGVVTTFLKEYQTHPASLRVASAVIAQFIDAMAQAGELTNWTIAFVGKEGGGYGGLADGYFGDLSVEMLKRTRSRAHDDRYSIKTLVSPRDEQIDITEDQWAAALQATQSRWQGDAGRNQAVDPPAEPSGPVVREVRGFGKHAEPDRGLLLLYLIDPALSGVEEIKDADPVLAWAISFPRSNSGTKVPYEVNNVLWTQINGWAD